MPKPDLGEFLALVERSGVTHTFLPPTLDLHAARPSRARRTRNCQLAAMLLVRRGADVRGPAGGGDRAIGPVMAQLFGQTEAPMMISIAAAGGPFRLPDGHRRRRLGSAGRPAPLVTVAIMDEQGGCCRPASAAKSWSAARW